jgi:chromosome segregation ATPase
LRSEMQQVRDELGRERSGRRDCDQHLAETTSELRRANHRIDSQGREIAALKSEIGMLRAAVDMNSQRIDLQDLQTDQSVPPGPNPFDQQGEPA